MKTYLGVDGGGTKTEFLLINEAGRVLARCREGCAYYLETGIDSMRAMLARGIKATLSEGGVAVNDLSFAFIGLPSHGENSRLLSVLNEAASPTLPRTIYRCGNDMVCGWAGALAGADGINIVAGTGSIAYGQYGGRAARAGGWGELFSDEGSAYWVAREGLSLFSRMSDGRAAKGALYELLREHFHLHDDLDLCAAVYGPPALTRSEIADLARIVAQAAQAHDAQACLVFASAAGQLAAIVHAVRDRLNVGPRVSLSISHSGGLFNFGELVLRPMRLALASAGRAYEFTEPRLSPSAGAALYAAHCSGAPLSAAAIHTLGGAPAGDGAAT